MFTVIIIYAYGDIKVILTHSNRVVRGEEYPFELFLVRLEGYARVPVERFCISRIR